MPNQNTEAIITSQLTCLLTESELVNIDRRVSLERLAPYLLDASQDRRFTLQLYQWDTAVSASLYGLLQGFEIVLRNTFHELLSSAFARADWYSIAPLDSEGQRSVAEARTRIEREEGVATPSRTVAELSFGFWVSLVRPRYAQSLWDPHLHRSFVRPVRRDSVYHVLERIRKLRNRVAHREVIIGRNLMDDYAVIFQYLNGICPDTARWVKHHSTVLETYKARPKLTPPVGADSSAPAIS